MLIHGSCHCGNIKFRLEWQPDPSEIPARACSCSFCVKHGGVWTSCPTGELKVQVRDSRQLGKYTFGTRTAEFLICTICGVVPVVTSEINSRTYAVVSVNAMNDVNPALFRRAPICFDEESQSTRLARRARGWIPDVEFSNGDA